MTTPADNLEVWMDGECTVCRSSQKFCESRAPKGRLRFQDFRVATDAELPMSRDAHESSMWVRDADGKILEGFIAWRRIMAELPGWRWLATVSGIPPARWVGPIIYRLVARYRFALRSGGWLRPTRRRDTAGRNPVE